MKCLSAVVFLIVFATGCKGEQVDATVECEVTKSGTVDCTVQQTKGTSEVEVCWDFQVTCPSGASLKAERTCASVKDGQTASATIPADKVTIEGKCEGEMAPAITNLSLKGK